jgi:putative transposase
MNDPRHLRRLVFVWRKQPVYFVTTCIARRRPILANPEMHEILHEEWGNWRRRHGWMVGRYVIMPDHVHFLATPVPPANVPLNVVVGKWKEWTAKKILQSTRGAAPVWQPEFFDHLLRSKESLAEKWEYVRQNPVRAGLVTRPEDWPYAGSVNFA